VIQLKKKELIMNEQITFYYNPMSRARIVHWMLEEIGEPYDIKIIDWNKKENRSPEFLKINPMGKLPAIVHKGVAVTEGAAICAYLADAFPKAKLAPAIDDPKRGTYYRWFFFTINCVEQAVTDKNLPRTKEHIPTQSGYGTFEDTIKTLEGAVSSGYLTGDQFSAADLYLSSVLGWYFFMKLLEPTPVLKSYYDRCVDREAYRRADKQAHEMMKNGH
jgi:glutathione S-transferase